MPFTLGLIAKKSAAARTLTYRTSQAFTTAATSFTITGAALGTASADRLVVVIVGNTNSTNISGCTLGGVAMTLVTTPTGNNKNYIFYLLSTSGTTANVVASTGGSTTRAVIGVYTILLGTTSSTPSDFSTTNIASGATSVSRTVTVPAGGVYIVGAISSASSVINWTSNVTENYELSSGTSAGGAGANGSTTGSVTVTASGTSGGWGMSIAVW